MAAIPSSLSCACISNSHLAISLPSSPSPLSLSFPSFSSHFQGGVVIAAHFSRREKFAQTRRFSSKRRAVSEETLVPEGEADEASTPTEEQTVSVSVSPSDVLTMFFKAEGTMDESAISTVNKALEEREGISDLKVQIAEGIASVELTKQTTVQATGVASSLLETIQGLGFKLQTLNLSFEDEEDK